MKLTPLLRWFSLLLLLAVLSGLRAAEAAPMPDGRYLYAAVPGIRNYLEYGGHGVMVYDIDHGHKLVRRIPAKGIADDGKPSNVKGICASAVTMVLVAKRMSSTTMTLPGMRTESSSSFFVRT